MALAERERKRRRTHRDRQHAPGRGGPNADEQRVDVVVKVRRDRRRRVGRKNALPDLSPTDRQERRIAARPSPAVRHRHRRKSYQHHHRR